MTGVTGVWGIHNDRRDGCPSNSPVVFKFTTFGSSLPIFMTCQKIFYFSKITVYINKKYTHRWCKLTCVVIFTHKTSHRRNPRCNLQQLYRFFFYVFIPMTKCFQNPRPVPVLACWQQWRSIPCNRMFYRFLRTRFNMFNDRIRRSHILAS